MTKPKLISQVKRKRAEEYTVDVIVTNVYKVRIIECTSNQDSDGAHVWVYGDAKIPWHETAEAIKDVVGLKTAGFIEQARLMRKTPLDHREDVRYRFRIRQALAVCLSLHVSRVA